MRKILFLPCFMAIFATLTIAQQPNATPSTLKDVFNESAKKVLGNCKSWPLRLVKKESDKKKSETDKDGFQPGNDIFTEKLAKSFSLDMSIQPKIYDASFLRLLDTFGTEDPNIPDSQLMGIALKVNPTDLNLWGLDQSIIKHDCSSMLGILGEGGSNYSIPFFSVEAAFKAGQKSSSNQVSTFMYGTIQSPFDLLYNKSTEPHNRVFAAMRGLSWRLSNRNSGDVPFILTAKMLAVDKDYSSAEDASIMGNIKSGVKLNVVNADGSLEGQIRNSLQVNGRSYRTFYWNAIQGFLPNLTSLAKKAETHLPEFTLSSPEVIVGTMSMESRIAGWPDELCESALWHLKPLNTNYKIERLLIDRNSLAGNGLPSCTIKAEFSLKAAVPTGAVSSAYSDPELYLEYRDNSVVKIKFKPKSLLTLSGKPRAIPNPGKSDWTVSKDVITGDDANVQWTFTGNVIDVPNNRIIERVEVIPGDFKCVESATTDLPLSSFQIVNAAPSKNFTASASLNLQTGTKYNVDLNQVNNKSCKIQASLSVTTTLSGGAARQTDIVIIQSQEAIRYPAQLVKPDSPFDVKASSGNGQITLVWAPINNATSYNIYRGTTAGNEVLWRSGISSTSFVDTGLANDTQYFYQITAVNKIGESTKSVEISAVPKP